jgi:hypothetical protein
MKNRVGGYGGVIAIRNNREVGFGFNTLRMAWATRAGSELRFGIDHDDDFVKKVAES